MKKHIPNTVTLCAALSGSVAVALAMKGELQWAAIAILLSAVFDFLDGFFARLLKAYSSLGADLDSLADVVSFGVAPATIAFKLLETMLPDGMKILSYIAFLIVPFSVLRLAIFNNSTNQKTSFVGLPVPAHAMLWVGLVFLKDIPMEWIQYLYNPVVLGGEVVLFSLLLVSKIELFSLKKIDLKQPIHIQLLLLLFLLLVLALFIIFSLGGLFFVILLYILTAIFSCKKKSSKSCS